MFGTMSPVTKNGWYESLNVRLLPSLNCTVSEAPTVVFAIAAGSASVGAAIALKAADTKLATGLAGVARLSLSPHPLSMEAVARPPNGNIGNIGTPENSFRALRREGSNGSAMLS